MLWLISVLLCLPAGGDKTARNEAVARAREALSDRLATDLEAVRLVRAEPATWRDSSLGCPEEGRDYDPLTRGGYRVFLKVDHRIHSVHVAGGLTVICRRPPRIPRVEQIPRDLAAAPPPAGVAPDHLVDRVIDDLAKRTGADRSSIEVLRAEEVVWSDGSLGCPRPDRMYTQALVRGYRIVLGLAGKEHHYHVADHGRFVLCEEG